MAVVHNGKVWEFFTMEESPEEEIARLNRECRESTEVIIQLCHWLCAALGEPINHENTNRHFSAAQAAVRGLDPSEMRD